MDYGWFVILAVCLSITFIGFKESSLSQVANNDAIQQAISDGCVKENLKEKLNKNSSPISYADLKAVKELCANSRAVVKQKEIFKN